MNFKAITDEIIRQTKDTSSIGLSKAKAWANFGYERVAHDADYPQLRRDATFSTAPGTARYVPVGGALRILSLRMAAKNRYLVKVALERLEQLNPDWDSETTYGEPDGWAMTAWRAVNVQPVAAVRPYLKGSADAAGDTAKTVTIEGIVSGEINREVLTLTAAMSTTPVQAANTYTTFLGVSKSALTTAILTLQNAATSPTETYAVISPLAYQKTYLEVGLSPIPDAVYVVTVKYIPWLPELVNDSDVPMFPQTDHEVIVRAALTHAAVSQDNPQLLADSEKNYQRALGALRGRFREGYSEIPAWKWGGNAPSTGGTLPPYTDYLRTLYGGW